MSKNSLELQVFSYFCLQPNFSLNFLSSKILILSFIANLMQKCLKLHVLPFIFQNFSYFRSFLQGCHSLSQKTVLNNQKPSWVTLNNSELHKFFLNILPLTQSTFTTTSFSLIVIKRKVIWVCFFTRYSLFMRNAVFKDKQ